MGLLCRVGGSALALEAADVALFGTDLRTLAFARDLGQRVTRVIMVNIVLSMAVKVRSPASSSSHVLHSI